MHLQDAAFLLSAFSFSFLVDQRSLGELEFPNNSNQFVESLIHVDPELCAALDVRYFQLPAELLSFFQRHNALVVQVGFVSHHQHWEFIAILDAQDLLMELVHLVEAGVIGYCEYQQETFPRTHVLLSHGAEFFLSSSVQNVQLCRDVVDNALLCVRILNGWIIVGYEVALYKLYSNCGFSNTSSSHYDELVRLSIATRVRLSVTGHYWVG